jgi:hypothetical protein
MSWAWLGRVAKAALDAATGATPASASAAIVQAGPISLTWAEVKAAGGALPALASAIENILAGQGAAADYELVGEDALKLAALDPALAPAAAVAAALLPFVIEGYASGLIRGDPDPIRDAQTTRNFNPGDPAARL